MSTNTGIGVSTVKSGSSYWNPLKDLTLLSKIAGWWFGSSGERDSYVLNEIGDQDRELLSGEVFSGRAWSFNGTNQIASTGDVSAFNVKSISFRIKLATNTEDIGVLTSGLSKQIQAVAGEIISASGGIYVDGIAGIAIDTNWHNVIIEYNEFSCTKVTIGGVGGFGEFLIHDVRLFDKLLSVDEKIDIQFGKYVSGCVRWYFCENDVLNSLKGFDSKVSGIDLALVGTSPYLPTLVTGLNEYSLLNKFGYTKNHRLAEKILNGNFASGTDNWSTYAPYSNTLSVTNGVITITGTGAKALRQAVSGMGTAVYNIQFDIVDNPQGKNLEISFITAALGYTGTKYTFIAPTPGTYNYYLTAAADAAWLWFEWTAGTSAVKMANIFCSVLYDIVPPAMETYVSGIPTKNALNADLVFKGQAKYHLTRIDENNVKMPDHIEELIRATNGIAGNDWYDASGHGNNITIADVVTYEKKKQYFNLSQIKDLIILKNDEYAITDTENSNLKKYVKSAGLPTPVTYLNFKSIQPATIANFTFTYKIDNGKSVYLNWGRGLPDILLTGDGNEHSITSNYGTANTTYDCVLFGELEYLRTFKVNNGYDDGDNTLNISLTEFEKTTGIQVIYIHYTGTPTISGDITNLTTLTDLQVLVPNSLSGDISALVSLTTLSVHGTNTLTGDISGLVLLTSIDVWDNNTLYGDISGLTDLTYVAIFGVNSNITGSIAGLVLVTNLQIEGGTYTGSIAGLTEMTYCSLHGNPTVSGSINGLTKLTGLELHGSNSCSGEARNLINLTSVLKISGGISSITCTAPIPAWASVDFRFEGNWSTAQNDQFLIDYALTAGAGVKVVYLKGSRTSASDAAIATLKGLGKSIFIYNGSQYVEQ